MLNPPPRRTARAILESAGAITYEEKVAIDGSKQFMGRFHMHGLNLGAFHVVSALELQAAMYDPEEAAKEAIARKLLEGARDSVSRLQLWLSTTEVKL